MLFLVDRSSAVNDETVAYGGEDLNAGDAAVRTAVATVEAMESTYKAGLWEYGVDPGDGSTARSVTDVAEMSDDARASLIEDMLDALREPLRGRLAAVRLAGGGVRSSWTGRPPTAP